MADAQFRDSIAWQKSMSLIADVYRATSTFPKEEMFGLTNQLRRASISIASNIAEGHGMARGSVLEVQTQLQAARMLRFGKDSDLDTADGKASEVVRILNASIATNRAKIASKSNKSR